LIEAVPGLRRDHRTPPSLSVETPS
jgi:hypothetical protein